MLIATSRRAWTDFPASMSEFQGARQYIVFPKVMCIDPLKGVSIVVTFAVDYNKRVNHSFSMWKCSPDFRMDTAAVDHR